MESFGRCVEYIYDTGDLPDECLNDWPTMRLIVSQHVQEGFADAPPELIVNLQMEMKRLYRLWQVNRQEFKKEVISWYAENT